MPEKLMFVGPGRAGLALGDALWRAGGVAELVFCGRRPEPPLHPLFLDGIARYAFGLEPPGLDTTAVFLSVPDDALPWIAHALAGHGVAPPGCSAFHLSGALSTEVLAPLHARGYAVGAFHPLQSLADPVRGAERLPGSWVSVAGEATAVATARRLLRILGSPELQVPVSRRPLYHAAAVSASNHVVALVAVAARLLAQAGVAEEDTVPALLPLVRGTLENVATLGVRRAITGPLARGDVETLRLHLRSLEPSEREVYRCLASELLELVGSDALEPEVEEEIGELLSEKRGS